MRSIRETLRICAVVLAAAGAVVFAMVYLGLRLWRKWYGRCSLRRLSGQFARVAERLVPDRPLGEEELVVRAKYLDDALLATPSLALDVVRREIQHMAEQVLRMLDAIMPAILTGNAVTLDRIRRAAKRVGREVANGYDVIVIVSAMADGSPVV